MPKWFGQKCGVPQDSGMCDTKYQILKQHQNFQPVLFESIIYCPKLFGDNYILVLCCTLSA